MAKKTSKPKIKEWCFFEQDQHARITEIAEAKGQTFSVVNRQLVDDSLGKKKWREIG